MPEIIRGSPTRGMPCDNGKNGSIRRICASLHPNGISTISTSSKLTLNQPTAAGASNLMGPDSSAYASGATSRKHVMGSSRIMEDSAIIGLLAKI